MLGIRKYERIGDEVTAQQLDTVTSMEPFDFKGRDVIIAIKVRNGYRGAVYIKSLVSSKHRIQEEVLFRRGTKYKITSINLKDGKIYLEAEMI